MINRKSRVHRQVDIANLLYFPVQQEGATSRAVVIKNHGVVAVGRDIHQARAVVESLEEWAKILTVSEIFGGTKDYLT
jgi:ribulose-5-phosphate 4-epimerase/fuculose-1-phosphate aldolase